MTSYHIPLARLSSMTDRKAGKGNTPPFSDPQVDGSMTSLPFTYSLPILSCRRYVKWGMMEMVGSILFM